MKIRPFYLSIGLFISLVFHGVVIGVFAIMGSFPDKKMVYTVSILVPIALPAEVESSIEKKKAIEPQKMVATKTDIPRANALLPQNQTITKNFPTGGNVKPVLGLNDHRLSDVNTGTMVSPKGNTLIKEQGAKGHSPKPIKPFIPVPVFELNIMPALKKQVQPEYPEALRKEERQGDVVLSADIDGGNPKTT